MPLISRLFVLVAFALLPAVAIQTYNEFDLRRSREIEVQDQALGLAKLAAAEQQQIVQGIRQVLIALSELPAIKAKDTQACNAYLSTIKQRYPAFLAFLVADMNGRSFCRTGGGDKPVSTAGRAYFANALNSGSFTVGEFAVGRSTGRNLIQFAVPFYGDDARMGGVVMAALSLDWLADYIARKSVPPGGAITITDRDGTVLARSTDNERFVGRKIPDDKYRSVDHPGTADALDLDGVERVVGYSPVGDDAGGLLVSFGLNKTQAFTEIQRRTQRGILLIILGTSLVLILTWLGARRFIHRPFGQLVDAANQWRLGDYGRRVDIHEKRSEFARVGDAFNSMANALEERERELREAKEKAEEAAARITTVFESTTDSVLIVDRDWRITYLNERARAQVAEGRHLVGVGLWDAFPEAVEGEEHLRYRKAMSEQRPVCFETFSRQRNAWYEINVFPSSEGLAVFFRDVSEHKHALEARRISEERLRLALEAAAMGTWYWDLRTGDFLWSDQAKALFGLPPDGEMDYRAFLAALHPEDRAPTHQAVRKSLYEEGAYDNEFRVLWPDGSVHWLRSRGTAHRSDTGELLRMQGVVYDIDAQRQALKANAHLAAIVESSDDAMTSTDVDGLIRTWNPAAERLYGYAAHEVIGRPVSILWPPENAEEAAECFQRACSGAAVTVETVRLRKNRETIDVMVTVAPIRGADGKTIAVCAASHDITARKRMELALREKVAELQTVMDAVPAGVMIAHDPECRRMTASRYASDLLKLPPATNPSKTAPAGEAPENVRILRNGIEVPGEELPPQIAAREGIEVRGVELELVFIDGSSRHVFCHAVPLWDAEGKTRGAVCAFIDITGRKRAESDLRRFSEGLEHLVAERTQALAEANTRLRESEGRFRAYFTHAPECLFDVEVTPDGRFLYAAVNPSAENAFGVRNEGVWGKSPEAVFGPEVGARQTQAFHRCVEDGPCWYEDAVPSPSGGAQTYDVILVPVREGGRVARILGSARDITQRRLIEEQLHQSQKMEAVGQLTGGVAHDFNNLLTVVSGNLELIERRAGDNERVRRLAEAARQAADRGAKLTAQLLAFSRRQRLNPKVVDTQTISSTTFRG